MKNPRLALINKVEIKTKHNVHFLKEVSLTFLPTLSIFFVLLFLGKELSCGLVLAWIQENAYTAWKQFCAFFLSFLSKQKHEFLSWELQNIDRGKLEWVISIYSISQIQQFSEFCHMVPFLYLEIILRILLLLLFWAAPVILTRSHCLQLWLFLF